MSNRLGLFGQLLLCVAVCASCSIGTSLVSASEVTHTSEKDFLTGEYFYSATDGSGSITIE